MPAKYKGTSIYIEIENDNIKVNIISYLVFSNLLDELVDRHLLNADYDNNEKSVISMCYFLRKALSTSSTLNTLTHYCYSNYNEIAL